MTVPFELYGSKIIHHRTCYHCQLRACLAKLPFCGKCWEHTPEFHRVRIRAYWGNWGSEFQAELKKIFQFLDTFPNLKSFAAEDVGTQGGFCEQEAGHLTSVLPSSSPAHKTYCSSVRAAGGTVSQNKGKHYVKSL